MALRLVKTRFPAERRDEFLRAIDELQVEQTWTAELEADAIEAEILVDVSETEAVIDAIESRFGTLEDFRIVLMSVEGTVPRPEAEEEEEEEVEQEEEESDEGSRAPISIEELYSDVTGGMAVDGSYTVMVLLSSVVAAVGILRNDVAMVIAAMIIAPLLKPNMALSLATTLADRELALRSLKVNVYGIGLAVATSVVFGYLFTVDPTMSQTVFRTKFGLLEFLLAGSAGAAGAMSFTTGEADEVVGVMVAVALLPPVVVFGMLLGGGRWNLAAGALLLTFTNIVCMNLAGMLTFFLQRIRPRTAFEEEKARSARRWAVAIWLALIGAIILVLVFGAEFRRYP